MSKDFDEEAEFDAFYKAFMASKLPPRVRGPGRPPDQPRRAERYVDGVLRIEREESCNRSEAVRRFCARQTPPMTFGHIVRIVAEFEHAPSSDDEYESWRDRCSDEAIEAWHARHNADGD